MATGDTGKGRARQVRERDDRRCRRSNIARPRARREAPAPSGERVTARVPERDRNPAHWRYTGDVGSARRSAANCRLRPARLHRRRGAVSRSLNSVVAADVAKGGCASARRRGQALSPRASASMATSDSGEAAHGKSASAARSGSDADVAAAPCLAGRAADARARCRRRARDTRTQ